MVVVESAIQLVMSHDCGHKPGPSEVYDLL